MKKIILVALVLVSGTASYSQTKSTAKPSIVTAIDKFVTRPSVEGPLTFLSADEMRGRDTGSPELDIAANYLASQFYAWGLKTLPGADHYFQKVELEKAFPLTSAEVTFGTDVLKLKEDFIVPNGSASSWSGEFVYVGYGTAEEIPANVARKMVVSIAGSRDSNSPQLIFSASREKFKRVKDAGAAGLIEYFVTLPMPWQALVGYFSGGDRVGLKSEGVDIPRIWMKDSQAAGFKQLIDKKTLTGSVKLEGPKSVPLPAKNVVAMIEGSDPVLKKEYYVISGHYDHVGVGPKKGQDSIYNGARDNALGTVGMMTAARFFSINKPKRSVIFMALTGEEKGLLGSAWYAEHPLVPLSQTIFNFDCDGAGYNDTGIATIIGLEKTNASATISKACAAFGIKAAGDPVPEQNLYERSDNYNFAKKGIPAIDFAPGIKAFDAELLKYYHQPADEVGSLDFDYLLKYYKAFVYANHLLVNAPKAPAWVPGDKFEAIGKELYKK